MKKYTLYLTLATLLLASQVSFAQNVRIKTDGSPSPKYPTQSVLPTDQRQQVMKTVEGVLNEYNRTATLYDATKKKVTSEMVNAFSALFNPNAFLVKDYEEIIQAELVTVREYSSGVANRMERTGLQVKVGNANLLEIIDDQTGYWVVVVKVEKLAYNYVTAKNEVKINAGGRFMQQEFRFDVPKSDLNKARIAKISRICRGKECNEASDYVRYLGPSLGLYKPFISPTYNTFWESAPDAGTLDVTGNFGFSGGFDYLTNRLSAQKATDKNLFFGVGIHFSYSQFTSKLSDHNIEPFTWTAENQVSIADEFQAYTRLPTAINATEKLGVGRIEVPLGLGIRFSENQKSDFILNARLIPAFMVLKGSGSLEGTGTYDAIIDEADWGILELQAADHNGFDNDSQFGPFQASEKAQLEGSPNPTLKGFSLAAQLSPSLYFHLSDTNPNWSLLIGLDLTYHLGSYFEYKEAEDYLFKFKKGYYPNSLTEHYLKGMSNFSAGLRIGLLHRLKTKP